MTEETEVKPEESTTDSPEYLQSMVDKAEGSETRDLNDEDSSLILGKFKDVDSLANAYKELESKLGQKDSAEEPAEESAESTEESADLDLKRPEDQSSDSSEEASGDEQAIFEEFGRKYAENGGFTDEDYAALAEKGYPKEVVQVYEQGLKSMQQSRTNAATEAVGGSENLKQVQAWAGENLSDGELDAFNKQLSQAQTPEEVGVIYATLRTRYEASSGEANLVSGRSESPRGATFANRAEMVEAMSDPRYGTDPQFTREVETKVQNADFL